MQFCVMHSCLMMRTALIGRVESLYHHLEEMGLFFLHTVQNTGVDSQRQVVTRRGVFLPVECCINHTAPVMVDVTSREIDPLVPLHSGSKLEQTPGRCRLSCEGIPD